MEVFFHLFYDVFCLYEILNLQVRRCLDHLMGMPADWAELPFLEPVNVSECPAGRAPDDEVHDKEVMRVIPIKIYRPIINSERNFGNGVLFWGQRFSIGPVEERGNRTCPALLSIHIIVPYFLSESFTHSNDDETHHWDSLFLLNAFTGLNVLRAIFF